MPAATIIPECNRIRTPSEAAGKALVPGVVEQEIQKRFTFSFGHAGETQCESRVYVQTFAAALRVRPDDRMFEFGRILRLYSLH
ncbi:MAG: Uncharacterised protein [Hyphomonas sp. TMED17]|nr:MAG: Uncharacterised protein [Hyphomonas sp. TMED17]